VTNLDNFMLHVALFTSVEVIDVAPVGDYYDLEDFEDIATIVVVDDGEAVEIYLNSEEDDDDEYVTIANASVADGVMVARVADDSGNYTVAFSTAVDVDPAGTIAVDTVYAVATDMIEVTLTDALVDIDGEDFQFVTSGETFTFEDDFGVDYDEDEDGNTILIFEFFNIEDEMSYYGTAAGTTDQTIYFEVIGDESVNQYGEAVESVTSGDAISDVIDKIAPELVEIDDDYSDADEEDAVYVVTGTTTSAYVFMVFTEEILGSSFSLDSFSVSGYDVIDFGEGDDYTNGWYEIWLEVELDPEEGDTAEGLADDLIGVSVTQNSPIRDDNNGNLVDGIDTTIQDFVDVVDFLNDYWVN